MLNNDNSLILAAACVWGGGTGVGSWDTHISAVGHLARACVLNSFYRLQGWFRPQAWAIAIKRSTCTKMLPVDWDRVLDQGLRTPNL